MSVILDSLRDVGGRVSHDELLYQLARKGLELSGDELGNQIRHLELSGDVQTFTYYKATEQR